MRYLLGIVIANIVFQLVAYTMTIGRVYSVGSSIDFAGFAATGGFWTMAASTLAGFCFFTVITDPPLLGLARRMTGHHNLQYAFAYTMLILGSAFVFFVPVALLTTPLPVMLATMFVAAVGAFVGGWCHGMVMSRNAGMLATSEAFA